MCIRAWVTGHGQRCAGHRQLRADTGLSLLVLVMVFLKREHPTPIDLVVRASPFLSLLCARRPRGADASGDDVAGPTRAGLVAGGHALAVHTRVMRTPASMRLRSDGV